MSVLSFVSGPVTVGETASAAADVMHVQPHVRILSPRDLNVPKNANKYADAHEHTALTFSNAQLHTSLLVM